jgi:RimJ/RimL family protein N-acetyltransferase
MECLLKTKQVKDHKAELIGYPVLKGNKVILKEHPSTQEFYLKYTNWLNDSKVRKGTGDDCHELIQVQEVIDLHQEWKTDPEFFTLCIYDAEDNSPVGDISLEDTDEFDGYPEIKIMVAEKCGKGLGKEATKILLDYAFNKAGFNKISLSVYKDNIPAIKLYQKFGFKTIKEAIDEDNNKPEYVMELAKEEFKII